MSTAIERVITVAKGEVGYYEKASNSQLDDKTANRGRNNYTKYARDLDNLKIYNGPKNGFHWCDIFVDWCFIKAFGVEIGLRIINQTKGDCGAGCTFSAQYYKNKGRLFYSNPRPGDQIFFGNRSNGDYYHTGLVIKVENGYVYTIEGNTTANDGVNGNGDGVTQKRYAITYSEIGAYGRPNWELVPEDKKEEDKMPRYNKISEMPKYAQPTIVKMCDSGFLSGSGGAKDECGRPADLDLSVDMIRIFVTNDRAGLYESKA